MSYTVSRKTDSGKIVPVATMPVMVGDTVYTSYRMSGWYFRSKDAPFAARVVFVGLNGETGGTTGGGVFNVEYGADGRHRTMQFTFADVGKTVFLNREAALAKGG